MPFCLKLSVDRVEIKSVSHIDMSIIANKHCWEVISFNQFPGDWETFITLQMNPPIAFCMAVTAGDMS